MWKKDAASAAPKFEKAGHKFNAAKALDLAKLAFEKGGQCYADTGSYYVAAQCYEKAAGLSEDNDLALACGDNYLLAGQPLIAAEALVRMGAKRDDVVLMRAALDHAEHSDKAQDVARKLFMWFAQKDVDEAAALAPRLLACFDDDGPTRMRLLAASVILHLRRAALDDADTAFMAALQVDGFASTREAKVAEDLLTACKRSDVEAFEEATKPKALVSLDFEIAHIVKHIPAPAPPTVALDHDADDDDDDGLPPDDDDLPDIT